MVAVYILKMKSGRIIYVGCSGQPVTRFLQHRPKGWLGMVSDIQVKWYTDRARAEKAEARFIRRFRPRHNKVHNPDYQANRVKHTPSYAKIERIEYVVNEWGGLLYGISNSTKRAADGDVPANRVFHDSVYGAGDGLNRVRNVMREGDSLRALQGYHLPDGFEEQALLDGIHIEHDF